MNHPTVITSSEPLNPTSNTITRRTMIGQLAGAATLSLMPPSLLGAQSATMRKKMGVSAASFWNRRHRRRDNDKFPPLDSALDFLNQCHALDAGGIQVGVRGWEQTFARKVRDRRESYGMYLEGQISLPKSDTELDRFEQNIRNAREAGAVILRTAIGGRRYEDFNEAEEFEQFRQRSLRSLELAEPIVRRHGVKLAIENHKDWRIPDMLDLLEHFDSEHLGVCLDTGNSITLMENPIETAKAFAKFTLTIHFKDMAVQEYENGFLLSEVPFGAGFLDLKEIMTLVEKENSSVQYNLEMITRDPLKIPCLTKKYWATFEQVPGKRLADTLTMVRKNASPNPLPQIATLTPEDRLVFEHRNNLKCFDYARAHLGLKG